MQFHRPWLVVWGLGRELTGAAPAREGTLSWESRGRSSRRSWSLHRHWASFWAFLEDALREEAPWGLSPPPLSNA